MLYRVREQSCHLPRENLIAYHFSLDKLIITGDWKNWSEHCEYLSHWMKGKYAVFNPVLLQQMFPLIYFESLFSNCVDMECE